MFKVIKICLQFVVIICESTCLLSEYNIFDICYSSPFRRQNISPLQLFLEYSAGIQLKQRAHNSFVFESRSLPMPSISFQSRKIFLANCRERSLISFQSRKMFSLQLYVKGTQPILGDQTVQVRRVFFMWFELIELSLVFRRY